MIVVSRLRGLPATACGALLASATLTIVLAAQSVLACTKMMSIALPGAAAPDAGTSGMDMSGMAMSGMRMSGMPMQHSGTLMLCPVVLLLAAASFALTLLAAVQCGRDPHRAVAGRVAARAGSTLPVAPASVVLAFFGAGGVGAMIAVDGNAPTTLGAWVTLAAIIAGTALALTLATSVLCRIAVALGAGLAIVIAALRIPPVRPRTARDERFRFARAFSCAVTLLAAGRGLRAPPNVRLPIR